MRVGRLSARPVADLRWALRACKVQQRLIPFCLCQILVLRMQQQRLHDYRRLAQHLRTARADHLQDGIVPVGRVVDGRDEWRRLVHGLVATM